MDLNEKLYYELRLIIEDIQTTEDRPLKSGELTHVERIVAAYKKAGYVGPYLYPSDTPGRYRTGKEWYDRFIEEFGYVYAAGDVSRDAYKLAKETARKVAGIDTREDNH